MVTQEQVRSYVDEIMMHTGLKQYEVSEQAGYGRKSLGQLISKGTGLESVYNQLKLVFGERMKKSTMDNLNQRFTADQLFHMYMKAMERQDKIMDTQTAILQSIRNEMAREDTLAEVALNLKEVLIDVQSLASRQKGVGATLLESLERLEKREDGSLTTEADTRIRQIEKAASKHDSANVRRS